VRLGGAGQAAGLTWPEGGSHRLPLPRPQKKSKGAGATLGCGWHVRERTQQAAKRGAGVAP